MQSTPEDVQESAVKRCSRCKGVKTRSEFNREERQSDGLNSKCRVCQRQLWADYRGRNSDRLRRRKQSTRDANTQDPPDPEQLKRCAACGREKPRIDFHVARSESDGRVSQCKDCRSERDPVLRPRLGTPKGPRPVPDIDRFWSHTSRSAESDCWLWTSSECGSFTPYRRSPIPAYRYAYETFVKPLPAGSRVLRCRANRSCVNPSHLRVVHLGFYDPVKGTKTCSLCGIEKPSSEFSPNGNSFAARCRPCARHYHLAHKYGMSPEDYRRMHDAQGGTCAICHSEGNRQGLCVDHSHRTGRVRGLLCGPCNAAIGLMKDSEERLRAAASYLTAA